MRILAFFFFLSGVSMVYGQSTDFTLDHPAYQFLQLEEIRSPESFTSVVKPISRKDVFNFLKNVETPYLSRELRTFTNDSTASRQPIFKKLYRYPADLYYYKDKNLELHVNPALHFSLGQSNDNSGTLFVNTRGIEIRGLIDEKVAFYTYLTENQARYPEYVNAVRDSTLAVPYEGFWKQYSDTGVDFLRAQGYVDFGLSQSISAQLGFGKHFIGNGHRSLFLSDYANNYPYLRINAQTKIFDYTNLFAELISDVDGGTFGILGVGGFSKKYLATHHLNIKIKPNLHIGLFESVMYGDSTQGLKVEYLNPIIFYRAIEQQNGSEDNAFVGMDFKWIIKKRVSLYGQLLIDELLVSEAFARTGSWRNKQGIQLGAKYVDALGVKNLMLQGEINRVRPYTYAHEDGFTSYSHYNLALAHPLGANFTEYLGRATFRVNDRWFFEGSLLMASYGSDIGDINFGQDILKDYTQRRPDANGGFNLEFGNEHLQGNKTDLFLGFFRTSYMMRHNLFVDADVTYRTEKDASGLIDTSYSIFALSFRWNVPARRFLF
ncbi:MAG: hypothetical protein AAGA66_07260 [Bacteroidota bacterium]